MIISVCQSSCLYVSLSFYISFSLRVFITFLCLRNTLYKEIVISCVNNSGTSLYGHICFSGSPSLTALSPWSYPSLILRFRGSAKLSDCLPPRYCHAHLFSILVIFVIFLLRNALHISSVYSIWQYFLSVVCIYIQTTDRKYCHMEYTELICNALHISRSICLTVSRV